MASVYSDEYQIVIKALREARIAKGITQGNLALALERPQSFIAKVENGERRLDIVDVYPHRPFTFSRSRQHYRYDPCKI